MPDPTPQTIGDVITAQLEAASSQATAAAAAAAADAALIAANDALTTADSHLAAGLAAEGAPVYTIDTSVTPPVVVVYVTDTSPTGFHSFQPLPSSTPLPPPPPPG